MALSNRREAPASAPWTVAGRGALVTGTNLRLGVVVGLVALLLIGSPRPAASVTYVYLTVSLGGNGSGAWQSTDGQIDCRIVNGFVDPREACAGQYVLGPNGTATVQFNLIPATGSCYFASPSVCSGGVTGATSTFTGDLTKTAIFNIAKYAVTVTKSGAGTGNVGSTPSGISCGATCNASFDYGSSVTLTAVPDAGAYFVGWTGACAGKGSACGLTMPASGVSTNAVFGFGSAPTPSPTSGAVQSQKPPPTPAASATKPASTPRASAPAQSTASPSTPPGASVGPMESGGPTAQATGATTGAPLVSPVASRGPDGTPAPTGPPIVPAVATTDLTPIALAILGAGVLIAIGIGAAAYLLRRTPRQA